MKSITLFLACFVVLTLSSCKKIEGPGGSSSIQGSVYIVNTNAAGDTISEYFAPKEDVFIVYGTDGESFDDDVKTSYDGSFKFTGLEKGNYTVFLYEDCISCASGKQALLYPVEITEKKSTVDLGTITIIK
ncbi:MAG: hypothetical protein NWR50_02000 [Crocinitomicaceae bacterium]|jgi:hypothetical protein|nr:hypothetical protein [Crocinitomicaceae bacterium]